jgi:alpha 1,2-mannosyltransferase
MYVAELANAAHDGQAILDAPTGVRYRAALERGVYTRFHGGSTSALCVDLHFEDPRTAAEKQADIAYELKHPPKNESFASTEEMEKKKGMITHAVAKDGEVMRFDWTESPLLVGWWRDEPNIVDFEKYLCVYQDELVKPAERW